MSQLQVQHKTAYVNGGNRRWGDQDLGNCTDNFRKEYQNNRSSRYGTGNQTRMEGAPHQHINQASSISKAKAEALTSGESKGESQQHLHCLTACLTGQAVEVQVKCGSIYSGVFHSGNAEKDHGIVLKMARLVKDGPSKGKCDITAVRPQKRFLINTKDLVQIIAKDVPLGGESLQNGRVRENWAEMVTDSVLSQGRHGELERQLKPWTPDNDESKDLGLESTFENTWNRNWDQFEINRTLFGVESTFNEDLYTTKLEKGPQMREREKEAWRIAREIEGQSAKHLHLTEERVLRSSKDFELLDEESRFSSVLRSSEDVGQENEDASSAANNDETFKNLQNDRVVGNAAAAGEHSLMKAKDIESKKTSRPSSADLKKNAVVAPVDIHVAAAESFENTQSSPRAGVADRSNKQSVRVGGFSSPRPSLSIGDTTGLRALNLDPGVPQVTEDVYRDFKEFKQQENAKRGRQRREEQVNELKSFSKTLKDLTVIKQQTVAMAGNTLNSPAAFPPPASALPLPTSVTNPVSILVGLDSGNEPNPSSQPTPLMRAGESTRVVATEGGLASDLTQSERPLMNSLSIDVPISPMNSISSTAVPLSPSSSSDVSSSTSFSKKSSLNPHAKEFKLNPNAKSFTPNFTPLRPPSVVQRSLYVPGILPPGPPMQGVPMGVMGNPQILQAGQPAAKFTPYTNMGVGGSSGGTPFLTSPGTFTSGTPMPPPVGSGQASMKMTPQLQQPAGGHSYGSQQAVRYPSQAPVVPASTYLPPNAHMYSQQMMFGQPGQVLYYQPYQPYSQGIPMPPPQPTSAALQLQANHREMPICVTPPYIPGQQHFVPQLQQHQLSNPLQASAGLTPSSMPTIPPQGVAGGTMPQTVPSPSETMPKTPSIRFGGIGAST